MSKWQGGKKIAALRQLVADHYGFECWLCHELINPALRYPDPQSFTIDHVVPRKHGGSDNIANLRPAHLHCNTSRGAAPPKQDRPRARQIDTRFF
ncbi:HNH endonuclease [Arcanobacterium canis]